MITHQEKVLTLLQAVVAAKLAYWDALSELEQATKALDDETWTDTADEQITYYIEGAASGGDPSRLTLEDASHVIDLAQQ